MCDEVVEDERLCFWRGWISCARLDIVRPLADGKLATELSIVAGPDRVGTRGVVSSTSSRIARRSCGPCDVWLLLIPDGRAVVKLLNDFLDCKRAGRISHKSP